MPHDIEVDWWAEVLSDSNCCVQVDDHVPPAARDKHCFTRTVENLKLQWKQKCKHATSRDKISYGKRELWEREGVAQSSPGDMWMSQKLLLDRSNPWINRKLVSGEVRKILFSVVKREFNKQSPLQYSEFVCFATVVRRLDDVWDNQDNRLKFTDIPGIRLPFNYNL